MTSNLPMRLTSRRRPIAAKPTLIGASLGYARYSTEAQDPLSLDRQIQRIKEINLRYGLPEPTIYEDGASSGQTLNNQGMMQLLEAFEKYPGSTLTVESADRLFRSLAAYGQFQMAVSKNGIQVYDWRGLMAPEQLPLEASFSAMELQKLRFRGELKKKVLRRTGAYRQTKGYGYLNIDKHHVPDPEKTAHVKLMFELAACGTNVNAIARILDERQMKTPRRSPIGTTVR